MLGHVGGRMGETLPERERPNFNDPFQITAPELLPGVGDDIETVSMMPDAPVVSRVVIIAHDAAYDIATCEMRPADAFVVADRFPPYAEDAPESALIRWRTLYYSDWNLLPPWSQENYVRKPPVAVWGRRPPSLSIDG